MDGSGDGAGTLVIGCGNLLRGDDAAGPVFVRRMWDRGLPAGMRCADGGTGGMDVAFQMRGMPEVILVDACSSGSEPGTLFAVPGHEVENLPPLTGINLHAFRWDHAIAFARWLLKDDYPRSVTAYLIEGQSFEMGAALSPAVDRAIDRLVDLVLAKHRGVDLPRPQPVGQGPFPESHLLTPGPNATGGLVEDYNAFVRRPTPEALAALVVAADPGLAALARAAAFAHGLTDELPDPGPLDGELRALVLMTAAAGLIERGALQPAGALLRDAADAARDAAPAFAATLEMQLADLLPEGDLERRIERLRAALALAERADAAILQAELWMRLGVAHQQAGADGSRGPLLEAVRCYQQAVQAGFTQADHPEPFGQIQNNIGLAYLSMPAREASDRLRVGIAVQSFRHALEVFDRERHPDMWASVTMNLASALQYLPSSHPEENLMRAVDAYEEVLQVRTEARDPVAHARVLLNQANALAHLGIFGPAAEKLAAAFRVFVRHERAEEAATAREMIGWIGHRRAEVAAAVEGA